MKDAPHHLKQVQKKVLRSIRKENSQITATPVLNGYHPQNGSEILDGQIDQQSENRAATNHRVPRIPVRSSVH